VVAEMTICGELIPEALAEKNFSGRFIVGVPSLVHRRLTIEAADLRVSINRLVSAKLAMS
jgi:predicted HicB family RNase H-like nuclease